MSTGGERDWSEFIPDVELTGGSLEGGMEHLEKFGIVNLYRKWIGKSEPNPGRRTESIMVSCPRPDHPDKHPSAWLNSDKNVWHCGACEVGGDIIDLGAIRFGIDYRTGPKSEFVELMELMLEDIGVDVEALKTMNSEREMVRVEGRPTPDYDELPEEEDESFEEAFAGFETIPLEWERILGTAPESFLDSWMKVTSRADVPDEFLFFEGLQALGLAAGRDIALQAQTPVYPNLSIALIGPTGSGKTRSVFFLRKMLSEGLPFKALDSSSKGVHLLGRPASGEALYEMFSWRPEMEPLPMRGLVEIDEMSEMMTAARRKGSTLREAVIAMTDNRDHISHRSRAAGSIEVAKPFMALITSSQPGAMKNVLSNNEAVSGFANRFIYVNGTPKPRPAWNDRPIIDLTGLPEQLQRVRQWCGQMNLKHGGLIDLEPEEAAPRFDETLAWLDEVRKRPDGDMYARLELHAMKLIAILCINSRTMIADKQIVEDVHHILEWLIPGSEEVSEAISVSEDEYYRDKVLAKIEMCQANSEHPPTRGELRNAVNYRRRDRFKTDQAIATLERSGTIRQIRPKPDKDKRTVVRWVLNT